LLEVQLTVVKDGIFEFFAESIGFIAGDCFSLFEC